MTRAKPVIAAKRKKEVAPLHRGTTSGKCLPTVSLPTALCEVKR